MYLPHWPIPSTLGNRQIDYETVFERATIILEELGNPHQKLPPTIHISGTNGKGSSAAFLAKFFEISGYRTHLYTSPHLHDCNERIILNGQKISDDFLYKTIEEVRLASEKHPQVPLTFMEGFTIAAFLAFSKVEADILILECGMGGRVDITNIIEKKIATLITPVSFDHMEYLTDNIERIALEKTMIMRPNTPLIVSSQASKAKNIIKILAEDQKIKTYSYDDNFAIAKNEDTDEFDFHHQELEPLRNLPKPSLLGDHQYINIASSLAVIFALKDQFKIDEKNIRKAIKETSWPSRLEKIENNLSKLLKNPASELYIDGAHNESGAFALNKWLEDQNDDKENYIICGFSLEKCKKEFLEKFRSRKIHAIRVDGEPYPESSETIYEIGKKSNLNIKKNDDLLDAIYKISKEVGDKSCRIIICGSLHLARDVKKFNKINSDLSCQQ